MLSASERGTTAAFLKDRFQYDILWQPCHEVEVIGLVANSDRQPKDPASPAATQMSMPGRRKRYVRLLFPIDEGRSLFDAAGD